MREPLIYEYAEKIGKLKSYKVRQAKIRNQGLIVVNLHFATPKAKVDVLTVRYTFLDKFVSFGGSFGIILGCTFLELVHISVLFFKDIIVMLKKWLSPNEKRESP